MKPKTELALRNAPYVLIGVATVGAIVAALAMIIVHMAIGDLFPLLFLVGAVVFVVLFLLLVTGLDVLDERNKARITELEMKARRNSSGDEGEVA